MAHHEELKQGRMWHEKLPMRVKASRLHRRGKAYENVTYAYQEVHRLFGSARTQNERIHSSRLHLSHVELEIDALPWVKDQPHNEWLERKWKLDTLLPQQAHLYALLVHDAHFYLNCWRLIALHMRRVGRETQSKPLIDWLETEGMCADQPLVLPRNEKEKVKHRNPEIGTLAWYAVGRDHLEHFDERILGGAREHHLEVDVNPQNDDPNAFTFPNGLNSVGTDERVLVYPSIVGHSLQIGSKQWDISPTSLEELANKVRLFDEWIHAQYMSSISDEEFRTGKRDGYAHPAMIRFN